MKFYRLNFLGHEFFFDSKDSASKFFEKMVENGCEVCNFEFMTTRRVKAHLMNEREEDGTSKQVYLLDSTNAQ
jgi:hypothetical protein